MAEAFSSVAKSRDICANGPPCRGFLAEVFLNHIIAVNTVLSAKVEVKIGRTLVKVYIGKSASGEAVEGIGVRWRSLSNAVSRRNQGKQAVYGGRSDGGAIIDAGHRAGDRQ